MPDYTIMDWNMSNLDVMSNEWTRRAFAEQAPVFLAEYFRWKVLSEFGGVYLDADCEIVNGRVLHELIEELYTQDDYEVFFGVEEYANGHPTAQTVGARKGAELTRFMADLYEHSLAPLWPWREKRGLIGPQLMSLYFVNEGINARDEGFFKKLNRPIVAGRAKIYPQKYFSPKFTLNGDDLDYDPGKTCVYHLFANSNITFDDGDAREAQRTEALTFAEYRDVLARINTFPRHYSASQLQTVVGKRVAGAIEGGTLDGTLVHGPYCSIPIGKYTATFSCPKAPTRGGGTLKVTTDGGAVVLAERRIEFARSAVSTLTLPFEVKTLSCRDLEVVLYLAGAEDISITGLEIEETVPRIDVRKSAPQIKALPRKVAGLKILHRVYFGFDGKPDQFQAYRKTWEEQLPDFTIMDWNSSNLPMEINDYVKELYKKKDHAFLTDYFRWYLLREHGGVYLDADVEVVDGGIFRKIITDLENAETYDAVIGIDEKAGGWYTAHSMASKPASDLSSFMCSIYENFGAFTAWRKRGFYFWAPQLVGLYFTNTGHNEPGMGTTPQLEDPAVISRVKVLPQDWFSPLAPTGNASQPFVLSGYSPNTCLCHHFACSWHDAESAYLKHSQSKGGQTGVLLKDIVSTAAVPTHEGDAAGDRTHRRFLSKMRTQIGHRVEAGIETTGQAGCLAFGPYVRLDPGYYIASWRLEDVASLGVVTVDVTSQHGRRKIAEFQARSVPVPGEAIEIGFKLDEGQDDVEFHVYVTADSTLRLAAVDLQPVDWIPPADLARAPTALAGPPPIWRRGLRRLMRLAKSFRPGGAAE